jgi:hypothetical protein
MVAQYSIRRFKKLRAATSNIYHSSAVGQGNMIMAQDTRNGLPHILRLSRAFISTWGMWFVQTGQYLMT